MTRRPIETPDGPALRYREGRFDELHAFMGDALVLPSPWRPVPVAKRRSPDAVRSGREKLTC